MFKKIFLFSLIALVGFVSVSFVKAQSLGDLQAQLQALLQQVANLQAQIKAQNGGTSNVFCYAFNNNLSLGSSGNDVAALQTALSKEGFTIGSNETNSDTFGESTASAVSGFQEKYSSDVLKPFSLNYGTGFAGKGTRAKLNSLYGCNVKNPPIVEPPVSTSTLPVIGGITVTSPTTGNVWYTGNTYKIIWNSGMSSDVKVQITLNSPRLPCLDTNPACMVAVVQKAPYTISASTDNDGSYEWTIPTNLSSIYVGSQQITVQTVGGSTYGRSATFTISSGSNVTVPSIQVLSPISGNSYSYGKTLPITWYWLSTDVTTQTPVDISIIGNNYKSVIAQNVSPQAGSDKQTYNWTMDTTLSGGGSGFVINICKSGTTNCATSGAFNIVSASSGQSPVISGVSGPTTLSVGQQGTWAVKAYDPNNGTLSYSVVWGDESVCSGNVCATIINGPPTPPVQQSTFTHTYNTAGTFTPKFTVTNSAGLSAQTSLSVNVGNVSTACALTAKVVGTNFAENNTQWGFDVAVSAVNAPSSSNGWTTNFQGYTPEVTAYGTTKHYGNFFLSSGPLQFTARDQINSSCSNTITVSPPSISNSKTITVVSPVTGQSYTAGSALNIKWTSTGGVGPVDISAWPSVSCTSEVPCMVSTPIIIASNISNSGSYSWAIPQSWSGVYSISVYEDGSTNTSGSSGKFNVVSGTSGQVSVNTASNIMYGGSFTNYLVGAYTINSSASNPLVILNSIDVGFYVNNANLSANSNLFISIYDVATKSVVGSNIADGINGTKVAIPLQNEAISPGTYKTLYIYVDVSNLKTPIDATKNVTIQTLAANLEYISNGVAGSTGSNTVLGSANPVVITSITATSTPFSITFPTAGTTVVQGQTYNITWSGADAGVTGYDVYLGGGALMNTIPTTIKKLGTVTIGSGYPKSFFWTVGNDVGTGSNYYIQFGALGGPGGGGGISPSFNITAISNPFPVSTTTNQSSIQPNYQQANILNILNTFSAELQSISNLLSR